MDDIRIIDTVEKVREYLLRHIPSLEPHLEMLGEQPPAPSARTAKVALLASLLNIRSFTAANQRTLNTLLEIFEQQDETHSLEKKGLDEYLLSREAATLYDSIGSPRLNKISEHLATMNSFFKDGSNTLHSTLHEYQSGLQTVKFIRRTFPLISGLMPYRLLNSLGYGIIIPDKPRTRFLHRLGLVSFQDNTPQHHRHIIELTENISRLTSVPPAVLNLLFGLFTGAETWKPSVSPLCIKDPKCTDCPLKNYCTYFSLIGEQRTTADKKTTTFKHLAEEQKPREKAIRYGVEHLGDNELLAIMLRTGTAGYSVLDLSNQLLSRFGSLDNLYSASIKEISSIDGVGTTKAVTIKAALEMGKRLVHAESHIKGCVTSSSDVFNLYRGKMANLKQEEFHVVLLDVKNRIFREIMVSKGSLNASLIHPREVFKDAIKESAAGVLFFHNHPSGDPTPSRDDTIITHRLYETGEIVGIKVLDHVIIGSKSYYSFADEGLLRND